MDNGVVAHVELKLNNNFNVLNHAKTDSNGNLTDSFNSLPAVKSRTSSLESEYELVSDEAVECSENECIGETEENIDQSKNNELKELDSSGSDKSAQVDDPSDTSSAMDEVFVIVDDDVVEENQVNTSNDENQASANSDENQTNTNNNGNEPGTSDTNQLLSDDDFEMDEIIAEFAEEENKKNSVVKLSDGEDEIDSLLDEFVVTQKVSDKDANLILSSDNEDEMECLLEEFSKENLSDDEPSSQNDNHKNSVTPVLKNSLYDSTRTLNNISSGNGESIELTITSSKINNGSIDENDCVIVCDDDKSDCSSVEILIEDDIDDKVNDDILTNQGTEKNSLKGFTSEEPTTSELDPEQKLNFEDMVIVDEVQDTSDTDISKFISDSEHFHPASPGNSPFHITSEIDISSVEPNDYSSAHDSTLDMVSNISISSVKCDDPANPENSTSQITSTIKITSVNSNDSASLTNSALDTTSNLDISSVETSNPVSISTGTLEVTSKMDISSFETSNPVSLSTGALEAASEMDISSVNPSHPANLNNTTLHVASDVDNFIVEPCVSLSNNTLHVTSKMDTTSSFDPVSPGNSTLHIPSKMDVSSFESSRPISPSSSILKIALQNDFSNSELIKSVANENMTVQPETNTNCPPSNQKDPNVLSGDIKKIENIDFELNSETTELNCGNDIPAISEEIFKPSNVSNDSNPPETSDEAPKQSNSSRSFANETELKSLGMQTNTGKEMEIATEPVETVVEDEARNVQGLGSAAGINSDDEVKTHLIGAVPNDIVDTSSISAESNIITGEESNNTEPADANDKTKDDIQNFKLLMEPNALIDDENKKIDSTSNDVIGPKEKPEEEKMLISNNKEEDKMLIDIETNTGKPVNENSRLPTEATEPLTPDSEQPVATTSSELIPVPDEIKKRKLEDDDNDFDTKKQKQGNIASNFLNGDESSASDASSDFAFRNTKIEDLVSDVAVTDCKVMEKAIQFLPLDPSIKIRASKKVFEQISLYICHEVAKECFKKPLESAQEEKDELKKKIETLSKSLESFRSQANDFHNSQKKSFSEYSFKPKAHTRTVGVNVKIYRESEIKQAISMQRNTAANKPINISDHLTYKQETKPQPAIPAIPVIPKAEDVPVKSEIKPFRAPSPNVTTPTSLTKDSVVSNVSPSPQPPPFQNTSVYIPRTQIRESVLSPVASSHLIRRQLLPRIIAQANRPVLGPQAVVGLTNRPPPPNVTLSGNRLMTVSNPPNLQRPGVPNTRSMLLVPTTSVSSPARSNQYRATIDLTKDERKVNPSLVPIRDYLQFCPPGARAMQPSQMPRPSVIPPLPSSLIGSRTVTYIVPANSSGGRGVPSFVPQSNQPVQLVFRMTNAGGMPTLGTVVNSVSRMPGNAQHVFNSSFPRMSSMQTINSSNLRMTGMPQPPFSNAVPRLAGTSHPSFNSPAPRMVGMLQQAANIPPRAASIPPRAANIPPRSSSGLILFSSASKSQSIGKDNRFLTVGNKDTHFISRRHPAPFPKTPEYPDNKGKALPPKPSLKGNKNPSGGIVLSWNMSLMKHHEVIKSYQLYAYQETDGAVDATLWKKVGDVNALPLPMACTLTQFIDKNRYYFTVRAVDVCNRSGPFSDPVSILYDKEVDPGLKK